MAHVLERRPELLERRAVAGAEGEHAIFFFQAEDGIRDSSVTGVQTCALPIWFSKAATARDAATVERGRERSVHLYDRKTGSEERRVGKECRSRWSPDH